VAAAAGGGYAGAMRRPLLALLAIAILAAPAGAQEAPDCAAVQAERTALEAERGALRRTVTDLALGRRKRRGPGAGEVGGAALGTAATILLPFGIGAAVSAGVGAAARSAGKKKRAREAAAAPPPPGPAALVARQQAVDARLEAIAAGPCGSARP
jgi:hypothetical protein